MNVLDRAVWHALNTRQSHFAQGNANALRFDPAVSVFGAARDNSEAALKALGDLVPKDHTIVLAQNDLPLMPANFETLRVIHALQMVLPTGDHLLPDIETVALTASDVPKMEALAELTKPGPFTARTHELGTYLGIRREGRLAAMGGERLKPEGATEVSAICTHPDFRGQGLGAALTSIIARRILERGETPFLHVFNTNPAIKLYERLGFQTRCEIDITVFKRVS